MNKLQTLDELIRYGFYPDDAREKSIKDLIKVVNEMMDNTKYEYSELIEGKTFNDMGEEGWEYVSTRPVVYKDLGAISRYQDVFKRKVVSK